jgi:hypothetical protein
MRKIASALLAVAALLSIGAGIRYLALDEFMPYHAAVSGKPWSSLEPGLRTIILCMLTIVGGGFLAAGAGLAFAARGVWQGSVRAAWAALCVVAAQWAPTLYVTLLLRAANPAAQPPVVPSAAILALGVLGAVLGVLASRPAARPAGAAA